MPKKRREFEIMDIFKQFDTILSSLKLSMVRPYMQVYSNKKLLNTIKENENDLKNAFDLMLKMIDNLEEPEDIRYGWYNPPEEVVLTPSEREAWSAIHLTMLNTFIQYLKQNYDWDEYTKREKWPDWERFAIEIAERSPEEFEKLKKGFIQTAKSQESRIIKESEANYHRYVKELYEGTQASTPKFRMEWAYRYLFGKRDRIVLPKRIDGKFLAQERTNIERHKYFFRNFNLLLRIYFGRLGKDEEKRAVANLDPDKDFVDYLGTGMYEFKTMKRSMRIGKLFEGIKNVVISNTNDSVKAVFNELYNMYMTRESAKDGLVIVLSKHPYDIAGMSTGRGWRSCMNLVDGQYKQYVESSMESGVLIAYLCYPNDKTVNMGVKGYVKGKKINIQHPLGRFLVKPYFRSDDEVPLYENPNWILRCSKTYGTFFDAAVKYLQEWLNENWNYEIIENFSENDTFEFNDNFYYEPDDDVPRLEGYDYARPVEESEDEEEYDDEE